MKKAICMVLAAVVCMTFCACGPEQGDTPYDAHEKTVREIRAAEKNTVVNIGGGTVLGGVTEAEGSSHVANEKFELDLDVTAEGNKYDPDEVNVYGQFVSPSGKFYEMPAFWYQDYERSFESLDERVSSMRTIQPGVLVWVETVEKS